MTAIYVEGTLHIAGEKPVRLHYCFEGEEGAPVLMFGNSLGTDLDLWADQVPEFAAEMRVLRWDMRGHGRSSEVPGAYTIDELAGDALALIDELEIDRVHYCGLSLGGLVGQALAARWPQRLASLTLCATDCRIGTHELWDERIGLVLAEGMGALVDGILERWFTEDFRAHHPREVEIVREMVLATPPLGYAGCAAAIRDADLCGELANITAPTLCIAGRHDPVAPPEAMRRLADRIRGARLAVLEAAHLVNVEARDAFDDTLRGFLVEVGALPGRS